MDGSRCHTLKFIMEIAVFAIEKNISNRLDIIFTMAQTAVSIINFTMAAAGTYCHPYLLHGNLYLILWAVCHRSVSLQSFKIQKLKLYTETAKWIIAFIIYFCF